MLGSKLKFFVKCCLFAGLICAVLYGSGRLYYRITAGFTEGNIISDLGYHEEWKTHDLSVQDKDLISTILKQPFSYLGKGCQSYVFLSEDQQYVLKFVKYQRFRPQKWLDYLTFIPGVEDLQQKKIEKKRKKLSMLFDSWKLAFDHLQKETGLVFIHLNKSHDLNQQITLYDKMGLKHVLEADQMEFLLQKKADLLCEKLAQLINQKQVHEARELLDTLVILILSEYQRGFADNDHALMQNTGVVGIQPVHIDVGQFVRNEEANLPEFYKQELFSKTFKFRKWLLKKHVGLSAYFDWTLHEVLGEELYTLKPIVKNHAWSVEDLPH